VKRELPKIAASFVPNDEVEITPLSVTVNGQPIVGRRRTLLIALSAPALVFITVVAAVALLLSFAVLACTMTLGAPAMLLATRWQSPGEPSRKRSGDQR
jgi:hypothetical protein